MRIAQDARDRGPSPSSKRDANEGKASPVASAGWQLYPFQQKAVSDVWRYWRESSGHAPLIVAPTGSGKSHIIADICAKILGKSESARILMLTHREELVIQNSRKMAQVLPNEEMGVWAAGLGRKDIGRVTCAQVQSWVKAPPDASKGLNLVVIDEAHMVPLDVNSQYRRVLSQVPGVRILGLTATPFRMEQGLLIDGPTAIFDGIAHSIGMRKLIEIGLLSPLVTFEGAKPMDMSRIRRHAMEYRIGDQDRETSRLSAPIADEICQRGRNRKSWLVFCAGLDGVREMTDRLLDNGIAAEAVTGDTPDRKLLLDEFRQRKFRALVSCDVLTTGFDAPEVDLLALVRATRSPGLYVQMVGRGSRAAAGKRNCLVLDYGGNVMRHGPVDDPSIPKRGAGNGEAPMKICPDCRGHVPAATLKCPNCGHGFPEPDRSKNLSAAAFAGGGILVSEKPVTTAVPDSAFEPPLVSSPDEKGVLVKRVEYHRHRKSGKPDSIRVEYYSDDGCYREWLCPDHKGQAMQKYRKRLPMLGGKAVTTDDALRECGSWRVPLWIRIRMPQDKKGWPRVVGWSHFKSVGFER